MHSSDYASGEHFRGQRVLVVGFGNSGAEIALDLAERGAASTVSIRGAVNVVPREILGVPITELGRAGRLLPGLVAASALGIGGIATALGLLLMLIGWSASPPAP